MAKKEKKLKELTNKKLLREIGYAINLCFNTLKTPLNRDPEQQKSMYLFSIFKLAFKTPEIHVRMVLACVQLWEEKLHEFHKGVVEHAAKLKRQQIGVLQAFRQRMAAKTPTKPQWSRELLKHRKVQVNPWQVQHPYHRLEMKYH
jgi:hypothetical protein